MMSKVSLIDKDILISKLQILYIISADREFIRMKRLQDISAIKCERSMKMKPWSFNMYWNNYYIP